MEERQFIIGPDDEDIRIDVFQPVEDFFLSATLWMYAGDTAQIEVTNLKPEGVEASFVWSSSDDAVATVDEKGKVTGVKGGTAVVTARAGQVEATCAVEVTAEVESVTLSEKNLSVPEGDTAQLTATVDGVPSIVPEKVPAAVPAPAVSGIVSKAEPFQTAISSPSSQR